MAKMDRGWAINELQGFLIATRQEVPNIPGVTYIGTVMACSQVEAAQRAHVVEKILDQSLPEWRDATRPSHPDKDWDFHREWASRGNGIITAEDRELLIEKQFEVTDLLMSMEEDVSRIVLLGTEDEAQAADAMHRALWNAEADLEMFAAPNLAYDSLKEAQKAIDAFVAAFRPGLRIR